VGGEGRGREGRGGTGTVDVIYFIDGTEELSESQYIWAPCYDWTATLRIPGISVGN
jgi:hypothetical protein